MLSADNLQFSDLYVQRIHAVTSEDIRQVARHYLQEDTLVRMIVQPSVAPVPAAPTASQDNATAVVKKVLANGMTLLLKRRPTRPWPQVKITQKHIVAIYIGFPGTTIADVADRYALHVLDGILSGLQASGGWLHTELRGKLPVYVVQAVNWLGLESGYFGIYAATQPPQVDAVIARILQQMEKAKAGTISDAELASAKQTAVIAIRLRQQTHEQVASDMAIHELYGLGYAFSAQEAEHLRYRSSGLLLESPRPAYKRRQP